MTTDITHRTGRKLVVASVPYAVAERLSQMARDTFDPAPITIGRLLAKVVGLPYDPPPVPVLAPPRAAKAKKVLTVPAHLVPPPEPRKRPALNYPPTNRPAVPPEELRKLKEQSGLTSREIATMMGKSRGLLWALEYGKNVTPEATNYYADLLRKAIAEK